MGKIHLEDAGNADDTKKQWKTTGKSVQCNTATGSEKRMMPKITDLALRPEVSVILCLFSCFLLLLILSHFVSCSWRST